MVIPAVAAAWALYAQLWVPVVRGLTHHQFSAPLGSTQPSMTPSYDYVTLPMPSDTVNVSASRLPTNEEKALTAVDDTADTNEDVEDLKDIEELSQHPVADAEIQQEREALQASGDLPAEDPIEEVPEGSSDAEQYNEGVSETAEIFDSASNREENDAVEDGEGGNDPLTNDMKTSMDALSNLPSIDGDSIIKPAY